MHFSAPALSHARLTESQVFYSNYVTKDLYECQESDPQKHTESRSVASCWATRAAETLAPPPPPSTPSHLAVTRGRRRMSARPQGRWRRGDFSLVWSRLPGSSWVTRWWQRREWDGDPSPAWLGLGGFLVAVSAAFVWHFRPLRVLARCPRSRGACGRPWVAAPRAGSGAARGGLDSGARGVRGLRVPAFGGAGRLVLGMCRGGVRHWCIGGPAQSAGMAVAGPPLVCVSDEVVGVLIRVGMVGSAGWLPGSGGLVAIRRSSLLLAWAGGLAAAAAVVAAAVPARSRGRGWPAASAPTRAAGPLSRVGCARLGNDGVP
jgi:hypothetical protein